MKLKLLTSLLILALLAISLTGFVEEDSIKKGYSSYQSESYCTVKELQKCRTDRCVDYLSKDDLIKTYCLNWVTDNLYGNPPRIKNKD